MDLLSKEDKVDMALNQLKFVNKFLQEHESQEWEAYSSTICNLLNSSIQLMQDGDSEDAT